LRGDRNRLSRIRNRLVLGMRIVNALYSDVFCLSNNPSPHWHDVPIKIHYPLILYTIWNGRTSVQCDALD